MKRIFILIKMIIMLSAFSLSVCGYTVNGYDMIGGHVTTVVNSSGMYLIGRSGGSVHMERVAPQGAYADMSLRYNAASAMLCGDILVALCNDFDNDQLLVYTYDIYNDINDSFAISGRRVSYDVGFWYDGTSLWLPDERKPGTVNCFSTGGALLNSREFGVNSAHIICGFDDECYVICGRRLYRADGGGYTAIGGAAPDAPARMISPDVLMDCMGRLYRLSGSSASMIAQVESDGLCSAAISGNMLYYSAGHIIYRYDISASRDTAYIDLNVDISGLYISGGHIYAASDSVVSRISPDEFVEIPDENAGQNGGGSPSARAITGDIYRVDNASYRISRIGSPTTFAQFKANMSYDGYKADLYRGDKKIDSGKVGTAMTAVFTGSDSYTYELSVIGDLTGEGNANSRDADELADYFLGNIFFDGVYALAADINDDGQVDILDFAMLCRMAG